MGILIVAGMAGWVLACFFFGGWFLERKERKRLEREWP